MRGIIVASFILIFAGSFSAQVANDDCAGAISLGTLPNPGGCNGNGNGQGSPVTNNLSNVGAIAESPYSTIVNCGGTGVDMSTPASDVWYSFVATGNDVDVTIAGLTTPNVGIYEGSCGSLNPRGCAVGAGGSLVTNFDQLVIGTTYYLQISGGDINDQGAFTLTLQNNVGCDDCLIEANLTATPSPVNGTYQAGQTVSFCYTITEWAQTSTNWFQGIEIIPGNGWATITPGAPPASCDGVGAYSWFNSITSTATGNTYGNGFYIDRDTDGNPGNNFGDNCTGAVNWTFCWTATAAACPPGANGDDLGMQVNSLADGEAGSWSSLACESDAIYNFSSSLACCIPPIMSGTPETCITLNDGTATASGQGTGPWDYAWTDAAGNPIQSQNNVNGPHTISGLAPGQYIVTVTDNNNCVQTGTFNVVAGPVCATCLITNLTANVSACAPATNTYTTNGIVEFTDQPTTGTLTVSDCNGVQQVFNAPFTSPINYNLTGQTADGAACDITAVFSADPACTQTVAYTAPICLCNMDNFFASIGFCDGLTNTFQANGDMAFTSPPGSGTLIVEINNGTTVYDTIINMPFVSPQTWSISGIPADGSALTITTYFSADPACTSVINSNAPADCSCAADVGTFTSTITGVGTTNYVLCFGDQIDITANGDMTPPGEATNPPGPTYDPGIIYLAYTCPPSVFPPDDLWDGAGNPVDPCLIGVVNMGSNFSDVNTTGFPPNYGMPYTNSTIYYVPITGYSLVGNTYSYTNTTISCYDMGAPISVQYLTEVIATPVEDCFAGTVTATVSGGLPAIDGSVFTGTNLLPATASFSSGTASNGGTIVVSGLQNGDNYSFDIVDANNCPVTITGTFTGVPVANAGPDDLSCTLSYTLAPVVSFGTGTWTGPAGAVFSPNANTPNATVTMLTEGSYTFTWTEDNGGGCLTSDDVIISFSNLSQTFIENCPSTVTATVQGGFTGVTGVNTASNLLPATAFFTNNTTANGGTITVDGLQNGDMYSFDITDDNGCVVTVSGGPFVGTPVAQAGPDDFSCTLSFGLNAVASFGTGTWTGPAGVTFANVNSATSSVTVPAEGSYTFTWTEDNGAGCMSSDDVIVTFSNLSQTFVEDCQVATVTATIQGGYTGVSGVVTASNLLPATASFGNTTTANGGTIVVNGLVNGDMYSFDVTDDNGCVVTVAGGPFVGLPVANAGPDDGICALSYTLNPTVSYGTGTWTGPAGATFAPNANTPGAIVTVTTPGTHTFTWTEDNGAGCISTDDVIIQFSNVTYTDNMVQSTCGNPDGEITLIASNGIAPYQYSIDGGATFPNTTGVFTGLLAGTYNVAVQDALGCIITGTVNVTDQGGPVINSVSPVDVLCNGSCDGSIAINATGATLFSIDGGTSFLPVNSYANLCSGTYNIVVENAIGCQATSQTVINQPDLVTVSVSTVDLVCFQTCTGEANVSASGGTGNIQYSIDNGVSFQLSNNFTGLCAGVYDVVVEDANQCSATTQITITEPTELTGTIGSTDEICLGACDGTVNITVPNGSGTGPYTYQWSGIAPGTNPYEPGVCAGNYSVTVTDNNGCTYTSSVAVNGAPAVVIDQVVTTEEICGGDQQGTITVTSASAVTNYYLEQNGNIVTSNTTGVFTGLAVGTYDVFIEDANQCMASDVAVVTGPTQVEIVATGDTTVCIGGVATLSSQASGGVGNYTYAWDNGGTTQTINVSPTSPQVYCVTATDGNGCPSAPSCVVVSMYQPLQLNAFSDQSICEGSSADISAIAQGGIGAPYTYTWDQGAGNGQNQTVTPGQTTVYTVTVTDGCESPSVSANVTITVNLIPVIGFNAVGRTGCMPVTVTFNESNVPPGSTCFWNFGDGGVSTDCNPTYTFTEPGCWPVSLTVTSPEGCTGSYSESNYVCVYEYPNADFTFGPQPANVLNSTIYFTNESQGATNYQWVFDANGGAGTSTSENPSYTFPNDVPGSYEVCLTAITDNGCTSDTCQTVVINEEFIVYVPNAFTPDGDGQNDYFFPVVKGADPFQYEFLVFNRWGELIYESPHPNGKWDGYYKGVLSQTDVYVWKLSVVDASTNQKHEFIGHVSLLK